MKVIGVGVLCGVMALGVPGAQAGDVPALAVAQASKSSEATMFDANRYRAMVADRRAYKVGDTLTVQILESANATTSVDSKSNRTTGVGLHGQLDNHIQHGLTAQADSSTDGGGQTERSGQLTAQISARVVAILNSGDLKIAGRQVVEVNGEQQIIDVQGTVRPQDIQYDNTVLSNRIADAHISYSGQGYLADKTRPGIFSRLFDWLHL